MENTSYVTLSSQAALRRNMDIVANNLANMSTHGYKAERLMFVEHLVKSKSSESVLSTRNAYVRDIASMTEMREGALETTDNPLDLAIQGDGFFVVQTEDGERYTRNGRFQLDDTGQLVNHQGQAVLADGGAPVVFAPTDTEIQIARDGTISTNNGELGKLRVVRFENPQSLERDAFSQFITDETNPAQNVDDPKVVQGSIEASNVQPIAEMAKMIGVHRQYDSIRDFMKREDERQRSMIRDMAATS